VICWHATPGGSRLTIRGRAKYGLWEAKRDGRSDWYEALLLPDVDPGG
jgi:hypothetical protein